MAVAPRAARRAHRAAQRSGGRRGLRRQARRLRRHEGPFFISFGCSLHFFCLLIFVRVLFFGFVATKAGCAALCARLNASLAQAESGAPGAVARGAVALHGDMAQHERTFAIATFKRSGGARVLCATDVAARGLDVKGVRTVVNYDPARNAETHIHRVGRAGRMGAGRGGGVAPGTAYTLLTQVRVFFHVPLHFTRFLLTV